MSPPVPISPFHCRKPPPPNVPRPALQDPLPLAELAPHDIHGSSPAFVSSTMARYQSECAREKILIASRSNAAKNQLQTIASNKTTKVNQTCLDKKQATALLVKIGSVLDAIGISNTIVDMVRKTVATLDDGQEALPISVAQWATMARQLKELICVIDATPERMASGISPLHFIRTNIGHLLQACLFASDELTREQLITLFAVQIEQSTLKNPAMATTRTGKVTFGVSTPIPCLTLGAELGYQHGESVNEDGDLVNTDIVSGGITAKASLVIASGKLTGSGSAGMFLYCKAARDHAQYYFDRLYSENHRAPEVMAILAQGGRVKTTDAHKAQQSAYLLQEKLISQHFSLLLSLNYSRVDTRHAQQPVLVEQDRLPKIRLRAIRQRPIRPSEGTITTIAGSTSASLGVKSGALRINASITAQASAQSKTTRSTRHATFCDVLKNRNVRDDVKRAMANRLYQSTRSAVTKIVAHWCTAGKTEDFYRAENLSGNINRLMQDYAFYAGLHASHRRGHAPSLASIKKFHEQFGAHSTEQCLCTFAQLAGYFYYLLDTTKQPANCEQLKSALIRLDTAMQTTPIKHDHNALEQHAMAGQHYSYKTKETVLKMNAGLGIGDISGTADLGIKIIWRDNDGYYNDLRAGQHAVIEYRMGTSQKMNRRTIDALRAYFKLSASEIHTYFTKIDVSKCKPGFYAVRFFKPAGHPHLPYNLQGVRILDRHQSQLAVKIPDLLPVAQITAGASYGSSQTMLKEDHPSDTSVLYFFNHFMAAMSSGKIGAAGEKNLENYWHVLEREQTAALAALFRNFVLVGEKRTLLLAELGAIEAKWKKSASATEWQKVTTCKNAFIRSCQVSADSPHSVENYQAALNNFKALMIAYYPHWSASKENSAANSAWS